MKPPLLEGSEELYMPGMTEPSLAWEHDLYVGVIDVYYYDIVSHFSH